MIYSVIALVPALTDAGKTLPSVFDVVADIIKADDNVTKTKGNNASKDIQTGNITF